MKATIKNRHTFSKLLAMNAIQFCSRAGNSYNLAALTKSQTFSESKFFLIKREQNVFNEGIIYKHA